MHALIVVDFPVIELGAQVQRERGEDLGSKRKFWFRHSDGQLWLFKYARPNTGEHWAEKIAAEIAGAIGLPHAVVELARCDGVWGAMTCDFTQEGTQGLVHGNELLTELDPEYPTADTYRVRAHTLEAVNVVMRQSFIKSPAFPRRPSDFGPFDLFVGYLLLDALIGNTDRHHENWGVLLTASQPRSSSLAPTFDHASSLGRELTDDVRTRKYGGKGAQSGAERYFGKARSALFAAVGERRPMTPVEAFRASAKVAPAAGEFWREELRRHQDAVQAAPSAVSRGVITDAALDFCAQLLRIGVRTLLE